MLVFSRIQTKRFNIQNFDESNHKKCKANLINIHKAFRWNHKKITQFDVFQNSLLKLLDNLAAMIYCKADDQKLILHKKIFTSQQTFFLLMEGLVGLKNMQYQESGM